MKLVIHPLFFAVMLLSAVFGGLPTALICMLTALLHECGHIFCAAGMGFTCTKISLMPYGAAAFMDIEGIRPADEIKLALAGPLVNVCVLVALAGLWWFFPQTYGYTDTVMYANLAMLAVNLLPAYPLDGGRVFGCIMRRFFGEKAAMYAVKIVAAVVSATMFALFFFSGYNFALLIFSAFMLLSVFEKPAGCERINFSTAGRLKRGIEVKYILCDASLTFKDAFKKLSARHYAVFQLYDGGGIAEEITQDELYSLSLESSVYDRVFGDYFSRNDLPNSEGEILPSNTALTHSAPSDMPSATAPDSDE